MIRSCEFSFDENSLWDPKTIRQHLIISEDQLNILRNIPEWTREKDDNYYSRIKVNDSYLNSQVELNPSCTSLRNQEFINCNLKFDKNFDSRENIIKAYKLSALKFSKSVSLFEIDKIDTISSCGNPLSPALSLPNLSLFSKDFSEQFKTKNYLSENSDLSFQFELGVLNIRKSQTCVENTKMEVVSQLPTVVPQIVKNNENFAIVEKAIQSASQTLQTSDTSNNSCGLLTTFEDVNKSDNFGSAVTKKINFIQINENIPSNINYGIIVNNNNDLDLHEHSTKLAEPTDLNLLGKKEIDLSIVKESAVNNSTHDANEKKRSDLESLNTNNMNELQDVAVKENVINVDSSLNKDKNVCTLMEEDKLNKSIETSVINSRQHDVPQLCESKITDIPDDSKMNADIALKAACLGAGDGQVLTKENLPLKRKLESKGRSSKRNKGSKEKQGCVNERSIKKSGEIHYSVEETKIMFDLLKLFL